MPKRKSNTINLEELKKLIYETIKSNPAMYPLIVEIATFSFQEYKKGLDQMESNLLLLCGMVNKYGRKQILKKINPDMFHPYIVKQLKGEFGTKEERI